MKSPSNLVHTLLIIVLAFLSLSGLGGGIGLLIDPSGALAIGICRRFQKCPGGLWKTRLLATVLRNLRATARSTVAGVWAVLDQYHFKHEARFPQTTQSLTAPRGWSTQSGEKGLL
jgi:hypothetical protein